MNEMENAKRLAARKSKVYGKKKRSRQKHHHVNSKKPVPTLEQLQKMQVGILNDIERQQKRIQNLKMLQAQEELTKAYKRDAAENP